MQKHDYKEGDRVYFIRRCSEQTALMSPVETGTYVEQMPGWIFNIHLRIQPDEPGSKTVTVPLRRVWRMNEDGLVETRKYVLEIRKRQQSSCNKMKEKLEASEWKLAQIDRILQDIS